LSNRNSFLKPGHFLVFWLMAYVLAFCLMPANGHAWFYHADRQDKTDFPVFQGKQALSGSASRYFLLPNRPGKEQENLVYPGSLPAGGEAGEIDIDISFDTLSKIAIIPEASLDRQIAANLRLKNILDDYLALKKRNAQVLKDLRIPYLENKGGPEKGRPEAMPEQTRAAHKIREAMENLIVFSGGVGAVRHNRQAIVSQVTGGAKQQGQTSGSVDSISRRGHSPGGGAIAGSRGSQVSSGGGSDLPWVLSFALKLIRYTFDNKFEILIWAAVLTMSGLMAIVVVKR